jgi:hypothetical protein
VVERRSITEGRGVDVHRLDGSSPRPVEGSRTRAVADREDHPRADDGVVEERLQVRPRSRGEDGHPSGHVAHAREGQPNRQPRTGTVIGGYIDW